MEQRNIEKINIFNLFRSLLIKKGNKQRAQTILLQTCFKLKSMGYEPISIFSLAVLNAAPLIHLKSIRIRATVYQIPTALTQIQQIKLGIKNIIENTDDISELYLELLHCVKGTGKTILKKIQIHKAAEKNQSFLNIKF